MVPYCGEGSGGRRGGGAGGWEVEVVGYIGGIRWAGLSINGIISENLPCHVLIIFGGHLSSNICPGLLDYLLME